MIYKKEIKESVLFNEAQFFRVKGVWIAIILGMLFSIAFSFFLLLSKNKLHMKDAGGLFFVILILEISLLYLFYILKLETVVTGEGIYYKWAPFYRRYRFVERNKIETAMVDNTPVFNYRWVHIMKPGKGIHFHLTNNRQIFIGSSNINSFQAAVDKMRKRKI